mgnify:CR=1 FL=1
MNFKFAVMAAAVLGAASTAQAADLAKKAPAAANYVKVCDAYGAGFFYIPGSDTCLKIGGYVYAQYGAYKTSAGYGSIGALSYGTRRGENAISTGARWNLSFDARTNTEMGLLRSYIEVQQTIGSQPWMNGVTGGGVVSLEKAFIQFAGLTAGRATSMFDFYTGDHLSSILETAHSDANVNLLAYTFGFGNGISATLSIEDPSTANTGRRWGTYGPVKNPDYVANINVAQAWGSAQLMGALHQDTSLAASNEFGFAVGGGVKVNLPMLGASDTFGIQAAYSKGALGYVSPDWWAGQDFVVAGGEIEQTKAWAIAAGLTHGWTKTVSSSLTASFAKYDGFGAADYKQYDIGGNLAWAPVSGLTITGEVEYKKVDFSGAADEDALVGFLRIKREF